MALHWSVEDVVNYETTCFYRAEKEDAVYGVEVGDLMIHPITKHLTFATMTVGINRITQTNVNAFYARLAAWEKLQGPAVYIDGEDYYITRADVQAHVGLSTNASTKTSNQFWRFLGDVWEREVQ